MKKVRVIGTSIDAIRVAEARLGRALPKSFSDWLLVNNGKSLGALVVFPVYDARDARKTWDSIVRHFDEDWQEWAEMFSEQSFKLENLLPFAEFGTGDYYCFDYSRFGKSGEPVVVLWSHETGNFTDAADNFLEFLEIPDRPR